MSIDDSVACYRLPAGKSFHFFAVTVSSPLSSTSYQFSISKLFYNFSRSFATDFSYIHPDRESGCQSAVSSCVGCEYEMSGKAVSYLANRPMHPPHLTNPQKSRGKTSHGAASTAALPATTWPSTSFLFSINELPINDDPNQGGRVPRVNENGRWVPPIYSNGFWPQVPGHMFRWKDGVITWAEGYQWYNGGGWGPGSIPLTPYRTTSMFWCNEWTQFLTANGDVTTRDIATALFPDNRWYPLSFDHNDALSRVDSAFEHQHLAGTGDNWIGPLGLRSYSNNNRHAPQSTGLAGNLSTVIGLIAFSCRADELVAVLLNDRAWRRNEWRGHGREHGSEWNTDTKVEVFIH